MLQQKVQGMACRWQSDMRAKLGAKMKQIERNRSGAASSHFEKQCAGKPRHPHWNNSSARAHLSARQRRSPNVAKEPARLQGPPHDSQCFPLHVALSQTARVARDPAQS
jgi:hypothetical protein